MTMTAERRTALSVALTVLALFAIFGLTFLFVIAPNQARADDAGFELEQLNTEITAREVELTRLQGLQAEVEARRAELGALRMQMPMSEQQTELTLGITGLASQTGVEIMSIQPGPGVLVNTAAPAEGQTVEQMAQADAELRGEIDPADAIPTPAPGYTEVPLSMQVRGGFLQTAEFIKAMQQQLPRIVKVSNVSMSSASAAQDAKNGDVTATITASVFWMPPVGDETPFDFSTLVGPDGAAEQDQ